ncbi:MAG: hypothetical protein AAGA10_29075, partial [Bacteroidota bacterium]
QSQEILKRILTRLKRLSQNETQLRKYLLHLQQLSRLRNLVEQTAKSIQEMPITYDIRKDFLYKKGIEEGDIRGEERANRAKENQVITQGMENGLDIELISKLAGLTLEEVETRIKELGLA